MLVCANTISSLFLCSETYIPSLNGKTIHYPENIDQRVQNMTVNVRNSFNGLLLDLVISHGWNPQHHLLLRTDQAIHRYEQSKELKNKIRSEWSAYLSHLKALEDRVEERKGKAEAMLENALQWAMYKEMKPKLMLLVGCFI